MKVSAAGAVVAGAFVVGGLTGGIVIPHLTASTEASGGHSGSPSVSPSPSGSVLRLPSDPWAAFSGADGSTLNGNSLLTSQDLDRVGLGMSAIPNQWGTISVGDCQGHATLESLVGSVPRVQRSFGQGGEASGTISEQRVRLVVDPLTPGTTAADVESRLLALWKKCQTQRLGHWFYGPAHTHTVGGSDMGTSYTWFARFNEPYGVPLGDIGVIRTGDDVAVIEINDMQIEAGQIDPLFQAAALATGGN